MDLNSINKIVKKLNGGKMAMHLPLTRCKLSSIGLMHFIFLMHKEYRCFPYKLAATWDFGVITPGYLINVYNQSDKTTNTSIKSSGIFSLSTPTADE